MRTCSFCGLDKPDDDFDWANTAKTRRRGDCKSCVTEKRHARQSQDPDKHRKMQRFRQIKYAFGLDRGQVIDLLDEQGWKCPICLGPVDEFSAFDHDHSCCPDRSCGECVRGILCRPCNWGIGTFGDDLPALERATDYLRRWSESRS